MLSFNIAFFYDSRQMHNTTIIDCSTGTLVTRLQQTVKQLTAENEEQHGALEDARVEVKELKEFMKSVSILKYGELSLSLSLSEADTLGTSSSCPP